MPVIGTLKNTEREYTKYLKSSFPSRKNMGNFYLHCHIFPKVCTAFIILEMCFVRKQKFETNLNKTLNLHCSQRISVL